MKFANTLLFIAAIGLSTACTKQMEFSHSPLGSLESPIGNPGGPGEDDCVVTPLRLVYPSTVLVDQVFQLQSNRRNVTWSLSKVNFSVNLAGANVQTSLPAPGMYSGFVSGLDECNGEEGHEFMITVEDGPTIPTPDPQPEPQPEPDPENPPQPPVVTGKADILFVIHNGFTMFTELRDTIPYRFKNFISDLNGDYQIGYTSGDTTGIQPYVAGGLANILRTAVPGPGHEILPKQKVITPAMGEYTHRNFIATLMRPEAICVQVSTRRCPLLTTAYQRAIAGATLAINRSESQVLFRDGVPLHIIIIADKDESGGDMQTPERFLESVKAKWPNKDVKVHSVIRKSLNHTCSGITGVEATKAPIYEKLSNLTGGVVTSICDEFDRTGIKAITDQINQ